MFCKETNIKRNRLYYMRASCLAILLAFLHTIGAFACDCNERGITEKFVQSDFVAHAKVIKIYKNETAEEIYKADIRIYELYKGEKLESVYVYGRSDEKMGSSCSIQIPENTELMIYAHRDEQGRYGIGMCSGLLYLNNGATPQATKKREFEILETFKRNNIHFTDPVDYHDNGYLYGVLKKFDGITLEKNFAIYQITFQPDLSIKNIEIISGFDDEIDAELLDLIRQVEWTSDHQGQRDKVPENSRFLLGIYFYPAEGENKSFLSQFYL